MQCQRVHHGKVLNYRSRVLLPCWRVHHGKVLNNWSRVHGDSESSDAMLESSSRKGSE